MKTLNPILSLVAGVLALLMSAQAIWIIALYLIVVGLLDLFVKQS
ncbi:DUF3096 domain-containing protein [Candidatus Berkelbacteria bacterium]|nr:DUF3096 domain-containing protein [Candidatus Berkelbacteria bacterium]MBI2588240.1 DUF3096 domain-containing protein [Candidatus Berkelbacteria bacterium]MBI4029559.1 DUF3096 domain-containing protein [Candidatus Berkelbacteria bacterium]